MYVIPPSHHVSCEPNHDTIQVIPELFKAATYPITTLIAMFWGKHHEEVKNGTTIDPCAIEVLSMLERTLNYAHTGNAAVLCKKLMDRSWLSLDLIKDGFPCLSDAFLAHGGLSLGELTVRSTGWPIDSKTRRPLTSSKRSQQLTYGEAFYEVCLQICTFPISLSLFIACPYMCSIGI